MVDGHSAEAQPFDGRRRTATEGLLRFGIYRSLGPKAQVGRGSTRRLEGSTSLEGHRVNGPRLYRRDPLASAIALQGRIARESGSVSSEPAMCRYGPCRPNGRADEGAIGRI